MVSRRCRVGRQRYSLTEAQALSRWYQVADSITCDAHKWLSVSMGCGMFFCRHPDTVAEAFRADVSYMPGKRVGPVFDPYTTSAQWSRRFIGLKLFLALAQHGESGYVEMIEHQTRMGDVLRERSGLPDGGSSIRPRCRWFVLPGRGSSRQHFWQPCTSARSRGCRRRGWAACLSYARASPASGQPRRISIGW